MLIYLYLHNLIQLFIYFGFELKCDLHIWFYKIHKHIMQNVNIKDAVIIYNLTDPDDVFMNNYGDSMHHNCLQHIMSFSVIYCSNALTVLTVQTISQLHVKEHKLQPKCVHFRNQQGNRIIHASLSY